MSSVDHSSLNQGMIVRVGGVTYQVGEPTGSSIEHRQSVEKVVSLLELEHRRRAWRGEAHVVTPIQSLHQSDVMPRLRKIQLNSTRFALTFLRHRADDFVRLFHPLHAFNKWQSLRAGLTLGLALGCISLVLSHLAPPVAPVVTRASATVASPVISPSVALQVPGLSVSLLGVPSPTKTSVMKIEQQLAKKHIRVQVMFLQGRWWAVDRVAMNRTDLTMLLPALKGFGAEPQILSLSLPTRTLFVAKSIVPVGFTTYEQAVCSAYRAVIAEISDRGRAVDAATAVANARLLRPGEGAWMTTHPLSSFEKFSAYVVTAEDDFHQGKVMTAKDVSVMALASWMRILQNS